MFDLIWFTEFLETNKKPWRYFWGPKSGMHTASQQKLKKS